jgi:hypothetical protein
MVSTTTCSPEGELLVLPLGEARELLCTAPAENGYIINWIVNGSQLNTEDSETDFRLKDILLANMSRGRNLMFTATPEVNNTNVHCLITDTQQQISESSQFLIQIQGRLLAPDVQFNASDLFILFSWSPPFSLNITDVEPDVLYYSLTVVTTDHDNSTATTLTTMNTTDTQFMLQSESCLFVYYQVQIAAVNVVGVGEIYSSPLLHLEEIAISPARVTCTLEKEFPTIIIQVSTNCPQEIHYHLELFPTFTNQNIVISNISSVGQTSLILSSPDIQLNEHYEAIMRIEGAPTFLHRFNLSTFDVQSVDITRVSDLEGFINITCRFAQGSLVKGCRIIIISQTADDGTNAICEYIATREEGSSEALIQVILPAGHYRVEVYDDEDVDVQNVAYNTTLTVTSSSLMQNSEAECAAILVNTDTPTVNRESKSSVVGIFISVTVTVLIVVCTTTLLVVALLYCAKHYTGKIKSCSPTADLNNYVERESAVVSCVHGQRYDNYIHDRESPCTDTHPVSVSKCTCTQPYLVTILCTY